MQGTSIDVMAKERQLKNCTSISCSEFKNIIVASLAVAPVEKKNADGRPEN